MFGQRGGGVTVVTYSLLCGGGRCRPRRQGSPEAVSEVVRGSGRAGLPVFLDRGKEVRAP